MPKLTVQFGDQMNKMLKELAVEKGTTKTEIIRRALATYKYLNDKRKDGASSVSARSADNETLEDVILP